MRAHAGATLVEVLFAGAIAAVVALSLLEGAIVATKISHENAELLAADSFAFDTAWKWLNKSYDDLPTQSAGVLYDSVSDRALAMREEDCPPLAASRTGGEPRLLVRVTFLDGVRRHGLDVSAKQIDVAVEWGPEGARRSHLVSVTRGAIERGTAE